MLTFISKRREMQINFTFSPSDWQICKHVSIKCREIFSYMAGDHFGDQLDKIY